MDYMAIEASEENYDPIVNSTYVSTDNIGIGIYGNKGFSPYKTFIYGNSGWDKYDLFIFQENIYTQEGLFSACVAATDGLDLRYMPQGGSGNAPLVVIPYGTKIVVDYITIGYDGNSVWARTTYGIYTGWCEASYLSFEFYSKVKDDVAYLYISPNEQGYLVQLKKGDEIIVKTDSGYDIPALQFSNNMCYCFTSAVDETGSICFGYVRLDSLETPSKSIIKEWTCYG